MVCLDSQEGRNSFPLDFASGNEKGTHHPHLRYSLHPDLAWPLWPLWNSLNSTASSNATVNACRVWRPKTETVDNHCAAGC